MPRGGQNGVFSLIDPVRLGGDPKDALARASQRAIEGQWLRDYSSRRGARKELIVVGDFAQQSLNFVQAVNEMMSEHHVRLFKIDAIDALVDGDSPRTGAGYSFNYLSLEQSPTPQSHRSPGCPGAA